MPESNDPVSPLEPSDALLDRATDALRNTAIPDGPSAELTVRTLSALREARARDLRAGRLRPFHVGLRVAAAVAVLASAVGVYLVASRGRTTVVTPMTQPSSGNAITRQDDGAGTTVASNTTQPTPSTVVANTANATPVQQNADASGNVAMASPFGIAGTVLFVGAPPEPKHIDMSANRECREHHPQGGYDDSVIVSNGRLANVVISVEAGVGQDLSEMASAAAFEERPPLVLDQRECQFHPRVLAGMVGQELVVKNSDPFLHNVHSKASVNPTFNIGQPNVEFGRRLDPLAAPERFQINCDLHPWMAASVSVFEHPYFAVSNTDGSFTIPTSGLADGSYTLTAWHETLGSRRALVEIRDGHATAMTEFRFAPGQANASPATSTVQLCANCKK